LCIQEFTVTDDPSTVDDEDLKQKFVLTPQNCADLWRTLRDQEFQEIVQSEAGEGAWKEIMRVLKQRRQEHFEKQNFDKAEQYEQAAKYLRRIREIKPGTLVYLANQPAIAEVVSII